MSLRRIVRNSAPAFQLLKVLSGPDPGTQLHHLIVVVHWHSQSCVMVRSGHMGLRADGDPI